MIVRGTSMEKKESNPTLNEMPKAAVVLQSMIKLYNGLRVTLRDVEDLKRLVLSSELGNSGSSKARTSRLRSIKTCDCAVATIQEVQDLLVSVRAKLCSTQG